MARDMTQTQTDRLAEVLDCDREAAASYFEQVSRGLDQRAEHARKGFIDDLRTVQAFARHRIAATQSLSTDLANAQQRVEQLGRENVRLRQSIAGTANSINVEGSPFHKAQLALDDIVRTIKADAIAALTTGKESA